MPAEKGIFKTKQTTMADLILFEEASYKDFLKLLNDYSSLTNNAELQKELGLFKQKEESLEDQREKLVLNLRQIQGTCIHSFKNHMVPDKSYIWSRFHTLGQIEDVMTGKECTLCGLYQLRPEGMPWHICHKCGGDMEDDGVEQAQGERYHHYRCKVCGHGVEHT